MQVIPDGAKRAVFKLCKIILTRKKGYVKDVG